MLSSIALLKMPVMMRDTKGSATCMNSLSRPVAFISRCDVGYVVYLRKIRCWICRDRGWG